MSCEGIMLGGCWPFCSYDVVEDGFESAKHIKDAQTYEEAVREVYRLNGWGEPKNIHRRF